MNDSIRICRLAADDAAKLTACFERCYGDSYVAGLALIQVAPVEPAVRTDDMPEVVGIDHIYITVTELARSEPFYDVVMAILGFRKSELAIGGDRHVQYFNRHFGYVLRPARTTSRHDPYAPGLHHLCFRVAGEAQVRQAAGMLRERGIEVADPRLYPEYAPDYLACHCTDPDGIRLEITNYRRERRERYDGWEEIES